MRETVPLISLLPRSKVVIHCCLSDVLNHATPMTPAKGLDRLVDVGIPIQEIQMIRDEFHSSIEEEEQWLEDVQDNHFDMLIGLLVGFFGSLIALMYLNQGFFNKRQRLGLLTGFVINIVFGMLHA